MEKLTQQQMEELDEELIMSEDRNSRSGCLICLIPIVILIVALLFNACTLYQITIKSDNGCYERHVKYKFSTHKTDSVFIVTDKNAFKIR